MIKKIFKIFKFMFLGIISLVVLLFLVLVGPSHANFFNRFKEGFYFEKYDNADEAEKDLLDMYPIGSDAGELIKILDIASDNEEEFNTLTDKINDRLTDKKNYIYFSYKLGKKIFFYTEWRVIVYVDPRDNYKITNIKVHKFFHSL